MKLELYSLSFESPVLSFEGGAINLGAAIAARSGVWTFEASNVDGETLTAAELGLSWSSRLNSPFSYVAETKAKGLMTLPKLALKRPISTLHIKYVPLFTKTPIQTEQFGALVFTTVTDPDSTMLQTVNFAWRTESLV